MGLIRKAAVMVAFFIKYFHPENGVILCFVDFRLRGNDIVGDAGMTAGGIWE